jgi:DNA-directed RNA polymerase II subunit RPB2
METITWNIIDKYFKDNPYNLVAHHLDSYNDFVTKGLFQIFKDNNPIRFIERDDSKNDDSSVRNEALLYLGGKNGDKIYYGKPIIYDESHAHYMYPNQARLRNMTYGFTIHYDVDVEFTYYSNGQKIQETIVLEKIYLGKFPIMLQSKLCILKGMSTDVRFNAGECKNDYGGYFIIDGKEKLILCQEKFADNMLYVRKNKADDVYSYSCEVRSVSEDVSKPIRYTAVRMIAPDSKYTNNQIVVDIPNVRKPIPLFILMRALGVISDKSIIEYCLLDLEKNSDFVDFFIPSIHDANRIFNQTTALEFISTFTKRQTVSATLDILMNYFLPHIGEDNFLDKAYYIGFMANKILMTSKGLEPPTDRDNFKFKRVETSGNLIYQLFREYYIIQKREIALKIDKEFYYHKGTYRENFTSLITENVKLIFGDRTVETGFKKGFKGNWGADVNTKRLGVVQDLNRLSWFTFISHLRKIILPMESSSKAVGPHLLHTSQWGFIDPIDTPDGGNIGLHKHMALSCSITNGTSSVPLIKWLRLNAELKLLQECSRKILADSTKVFVNGNWVGVVSYPIETVKLIKSYRRNGIIPVYTSVSFDCERNILFLYTDDGRLTRPILYKDESTGKVSFDNKKVIEMIEEKSYTWNQLVTGFKEKADEDFNIRNNILYFDVQKLYPALNNIKEALAFFESNKAIIDYVDTSEEEGCLIANKPYQLEENKYYTNVELDPSLILGVMGNSIIYPENNPVTRDTFSCGQSRQAVSMYNTNYPVRMDKMGVILNNGETPLVKSRYLEYINREEQPYGVNAIVAIMCYTGYNVEDAILINEGAIQRGLFRTTYFTMYESREEKTNQGGVTAMSFFTNIESKQNIAGLKAGCDYSQLDKWGLIKENTPVNDETILIGKLTTASTNRDSYTDDSYKPKKGQLGFVDKSFITEGEEGNRISKIRVREERLPGIGDKMACALPTQQVLTNEGWVEIKDIDITRHKVATLDVNGDMCYEHPTNKFIYDHNGKMYSVKNKQVEVVCTLNHKLYVKRREYTKGTKEYELIEAQNVMGKMVRFQKSMKNDYLDVEWMEVGEKKFKMDDWLQLLGMFISDGSVNNRAVLLSAHKQRKVDFNTDILTKLGIEFYHDSYNGYFAINIGKNRNVYNEFKPLSVGAFNKYLPDYVWTLSQRQCIILLEALMEGDGHTYDDGFSRYGTISPRLADDICRLAVHCGWSGVCKIASEPDGTKRLVTGTMGYHAGKSHIIEQKHTYYKISIIRKQNQPYINKKQNDSNVEELIDYEGKVYCIEMPSSHLYYMRENKFAPSMLIGNSRSGQKGTIGLIIPEQDMPFTKDGIRPDLIINPHAIPSRMTIGQLIETVFGKACALNGAFGDCTAFANKGTHSKMYGEMLVKAGYHGSANEILYNGFTGQQISADIYIGPTYYMRLKHMVKDKINYRARGKRTLLTRQTNQGRADDGGLRLGEMERDGILAHGCSGFLNESYMVRGDEYYMAVCNKTGCIAVYNPALNIFLSPLADGPLQYKDAIDGDKVIEVKSVYGRSFSIVRIPYSLKLLIQELQAMNVQMRIITEDNIDQLTNLSYGSKNIHKLLDREDDELTSLIESYVYNIENQEDRVYEQIEQDKYNNSELNKQTANIEANMSILDEQINDMEPTMNDSANASSNDNDSANTNMNATVNTNTNMNATANMNATVNANTNMNTNMNMNMNTNTNTNISMGNSKLNYIPPNLQYYYDTLSVEDKANLLGLPVTEQVDRLKILEMEHTERVTEKRAELEKEKKEEEQATVRLNNSVEPIVPPILKVREDALVEEGSFGETKGVTFADVSKSESSNNDSSSSGIKKIII